jgi:hypothetical protein
MGVVVLGVVMEDKPKFPFLKFFPADWFADRGVRHVSYAARGLWFDMICIMHGSPVYGHLLDPTGEPMGVEGIAKETGGTVDEVRKLLAELERAKVYSTVLVNQGDNQGVNQTPKQTIVCRRMVEDETKRARLAANGASGGNPALLKQKRGFKDSRLTKDLTSLDKPLDIPQSLRGSEAQSLRDTDTQNQNLPAANAGGVLPGIDPTPTRKRKATQPPAKPIDLTIDDVSVNFARFYVAYPRKKKKMAAWEVWQRDGLEKVADKILWAVAKLKASDDWTKDDGKWVPYPASFLNSREYLDLPGYTPPSQLTPSHESTHAN